MTTRPESGETRATLVRRGRRLEYLTIGWNLVEAAIAIGAGLRAGSTALVGFGLDSLIESSSGSIMLWRLRDGEAGERRERLALRWIGFSFVALAVYVALDAGWTLWRREPPDPSPIGIALALVSVILMPVLARAKRRVAAPLSSRAMHADSRQTELCAYLSAILLGGLLLNAWQGWWWADPLAALVMVPIIGREAVQALRGESCPDCSDRG